MTNNIDKNHKEALRTFRISPNRFKKPIHFDNFAYNKNKIDAINFKSLC